MGIDNKNKLSHTWLRLHSEEKLERLRGGIKQSKDKATAATRRRFVCHKEKGGSYF